MKTEIPEDSPFFEYIDAIEKSAKRASELTDQLLAFARKGKYNTRPINLNNTVKEVEKIIKSTFDKSIEIEMHLYKKISTVIADSGQMFQVIMNLCVNARDVMSEGGKLIIETNVEIVTEEYVRTHLGSKEGRYVTLSVIDTGIGMDEETKQRVFEPFFTTKEIGKGTGLGLSMVYGVVKNHEGYVSVYSKIGKGSTFKIYIPVSEEKEITESTKTGNLIIGENELILFVEDEDKIRTLGKKMLEKYGYNVLTAENGKEAVEIYKAHIKEISLVILDVNMPKMGGRELFLKLKEFNPEVRALVSSGYCKNGQVQDILDKGVMGFIQKPFGMTEFLRKVRHAIDYVNGKLNYNGS